MTSSRPPVLLAALTVALAAGCSKDHHAESTSKPSAPLTLREGGPPPSKQIMKAIEPPIVTDALNGDLASVKAEVEGGTDINTRGSRGISAIMAAAQKGHKDVVQFLLDQKADANMVDAEGRTARELARDAHHDDVADLLTRSIVKPPIGPAKPVAEPKPVPVPEKPVQ